MRKTQKLNKNFLNNSLNIDEALDKSVRIIQEMETMTTEDHIRDVDNDVDL